MISKLIGWGRDRDEAIARMRRALYEYVIIGIKTNIPFHKAVMENPTFKKGQLGTHFIDQQTTLLEDMKRIVEQEKGLDEKLPYREDKKKIAAIAAVTSLAQMHFLGKTKP